jgi:molybdenum cofactor synthesis domain-containing protein
MIRAAIITVSDSTHEGTRIDRSGPAVASQLLPGLYEIAAQHIVPDERYEIATLLRHLADSGTVDVIFTTGGTGIARRDVTPEATRDVIDREIPGLGEAMRAKGTETTRFAPLSRAIAGTRGTTLIINLPGSPKGAVESMSAVLDLVPHVHDLLHGRTAHEERAGGHSGRRP